MQAPSDMTKPARVASNGREACVGILVLGDEPAHRAEAGRGSAGGCTTRCRRRARRRRRRGGSARRPRRRRASRSRTPTRARSSARAAPSEIAIWPLAESTSTLGMKNGETRSGPRSRSTSCCSAIPGRPPIAEPTTIPTRAGSRPFDRPLSRHASCAAPSASRTLRSIRRASFARRDRRRVEALHLARDPHRELARVEALDEVDAALARDRGAPGRGRVEADRRDRAQPVTATRLIAPS